MQIKWTQNRLYIKWLTWKSHNFHRKHDIYYWVRDIWKEKRILKKYVESRPRNHRVPSREPEHPPHLKSAGAVSTNAWQEDSCPTTALSLIRISWKVLNTYKIQTYNWKIFSCEFLRRRVYRLQIHFPTV